MHKTNYLNLLFIFFHIAICTTFFSFSGNGKPSKQRKKIQNSPQETLLLTALQTNNIEMLDAALKNGVHPDTCITLASGARISLLHCALAQEQAEPMAKMLIAAGADITLCTKPFTWHKQCSQKWADIYYHHTFSVYDILTLLCLHCHNDFCFTLTPNKTYYRDARLVTLARMLEKEADTKSIRLMPFAHGGSEICQALPWHDDDTENLFTSPLFQHIFLQHNTVACSIYNFHFFIKKIHATRIKKQLHTFLYALIDQVLQQGIHINKKIMQETVLDSINSSIMPLAPYADIFYATEPILWHGGICKDHLTNSEQTFLDPLIYLPPLLREDLSLCIKQLHFWQPQKPLPQFPPHESVNFYEMCILRACYLGEYKKHPLHNTLQLTQDIVNHLPNKKLSPQFLTKLYCCLGTPLPDTTWTIYKTLSISVPTSLHRLLISKQLSDITIFYKNND